MITIKVTLPESTAKELVDLLYEEAQKDIRDMSKRDMYESIRAVVEKQMKKKRKQ